MSGTGIEVVSAAAILLAFTVGIPIGIALIVSFASVFEDWNKSLWDSAPNAACRGARRLMAATVLGGRPFGGFAGQPKGGAAHGQEPNR